jgi:SAM-dependent methyltransferase
MNVNVTTKTRLSASFDAKQYWEDRLSDNLSLTGVGYSLLGTHYNEWLYRLRKKVFRRQLNVFHARLSSADVLDIGSGTGFYIKLWKEMKVKAISGSDMTEVSVEHLRKEFPSNSFYRFDIGEQLPAEMPHQFDVISAFDVLFHIVDDAKFERAVVNISSLLKPGGLFCLTDSFLHHATERSTHHVSRSLEDVQGILNKNGLHVLTRRPVFVLMNQPIDSQSRIWRFLWRVLMFPVEKNELIGYTAGVVLYCLDSLLVKLFQESPTTELMICQREL